MRPATHRRDPWSSRDAELDHEPHRKTNAAITLDCVRMYPGRTGREIAEKLPLDTYEVRRRLSDLKEEGEVEHGPQRRCSVAGRLSVTWVPIQRGMFHDMRD